MEMGVWEMCMKGFGSDLFEKSLKTVPCILGFAGGIKHFVPCLSAGECEEFYLYSACILASRRSSVGRATDS